MKNNDRPFPHFNVGKMAHFGFCAASSLIRRSGCLIPHLILHKIILDNSMKNKEHRSPHFNVGKNIAFYFLRRFIIDSGRGVVFFHT